MFVPPQRVWILRRFGQHSEKGIKFLFVWVWNRVWFSRDWLRDCTCNFNSKWIRNDKIPVNKKERVVCEFEIDFNKSFCWLSNLSNNDLSSAYARSENCYGNWSQISKRMWKMTFQFGLKQGQDLENRMAQPHQEFPGVPAREKVKAQTSRRPKRPEPIPVSLTWGMPRSFLLSPGRDASPSQGNPPSSMSLVPIYTLHTPRRSRGQSGNTPK